MIRVHIVSGFLGAGKTTLIKKLMRHLEGKMVIIENEFGDVGIDGEVIERENYDVLEIAQGCICCTMKTDFESMILSVIEDYSPDHIIIEPTGIGMLSQILKVFDNREITDKCVLTSPITVVDALDYTAMVDEFGEFFSDQIVNAGIIVLSKTQLSEEGTVEKVVESIRRLNGKAQIISSDWDLFTELEYDELTNALYDPDDGLKFVDEIREIKKDLQSYSIRDPKSFRRKNLKTALEALSSGRFGNVLRAKGFVDGADGSLEFSYVNGRYSIDENRLHNSSRICIIGKKLDKQALSDVFSAQCNKE